jgi:hypothetical protein
MKRTGSLLIISAAALALLSAACGDGETTISVTNTLSRSVLLAGNEVPVNLFGQTAGAKQRWSLSLAESPLCSTCDSVCSDGPKTPELNDPSLPATTFIEVPPGKTYRVSWNGVAYSFKESGCACGATCHEAVELEHGEYNATIEYRTSLPNDDNAYSKEDLGDGFIRWISTGTGAAKVTDYHSKDLTYTGQTELPLDFNETCLSGDQRIRAPDHDAECKGNTGCQSLIAYELGCACSFCEQEQCVRVTCTD